MSTKAPTDLDRRIGAHIRARRTEIGLSRQQVATKIGVTFQQVEKYEKGTNRVSASRLQQIANVLGCPVSSLNDDASTADRVEITAPHERVLVDILRGLPEHFRPQLVAVARAAAAMAS